MRISPQVIATIRRGLGSLVIGLLAFGTVQATWAATVTVETLVSFGKSLRGRMPMGGLTLAADGSLYGTTSMGGRYDSGTLFKVDPQGKHQILHHFEYVHGALPMGALVLSRTGTLYGIGVSGGHYGLGTIYQFDPTGHHKVVYAFKTLTGGAGITMGPDGALYGMTNGGGNQGVGEIFRLTLDGHYETLHHFGDQGEGIYPIENVTFGPDKALYGMTTLGGALGVGTVYRLDRRGEYRTLHHFSRTEGHPSAALTLGPDGNLYGVTMNYGPNEPNGGSLFRITSAGHYTRLHRFDHLSGYFRNIQVTVAPDGSVFGIAGLLGKDGGGQEAIYRRSANGEFRVIHRFSSVDEGEDFDGALTLAPDGNFYSTTRSGGAFHTGTVFRLNVFDADDDGIDNPADNCIWFPNRDQRDSDFDGYGNRCDADLNNSGLVTLRDLFLIASRFGTVDPDADLDGNGIVNRWDLGQARRLLLRRPGPSGLVP